MSSAASGNPKVPNVVSETSEVKKSKRSRELVARDPITDAIRSRLQHLLRGMSSIKVAQATGHNRETVRRYLMSGVLPAEFIYAVCVAFGVCPKYLLLGIGRPFPNGDARDTVRQNASKLMGTSPPERSTSEPTTWKFHSPPGSAGASPRR